MGRVRIYTDLVKYKLSLAVTFSAVTGYLIFRPEADKTLLFLIAGVFFLSSGSAALNQFTEREYDAVMSRTRKRPLPSEKMKPAMALRISIMLLITGSCILMFTGPATTLLGMITAAIYNFVYTRLKRVTSLAVIPGALVGALPPLMGFTAAGGSALSPGILMFAGFMFMWQLPHFWLIIMRNRIDYAAAGFRSINNNYSDRQIRIFIFIWVVISTIFLQVVSSFEPVFAREFKMLLIPLNLIFILLFHRLLFRKYDSNGPSGAFILINSFSLIIMILFILNSFIG